MNIKSHKKHNDIYQGEDMNRLRKKKELIDDFSGKNIKMTIFLNKLSIVS